MTENIKVKQDDAVLEIIFARPDKKNALTNATYRTATEALNGAQKNEAIRVVLFGSEGERTARERFHHGEQDRPHSLAERGTPDMRLDAAMR